MYSRWKAVFQFPSNGKADPKDFNAVGVKVLKPEFQFPSNGKADPKVEAEEKKMRRIKFQFPSNGKADPK